MKIFYVFFVSTLLIFASIPAGYALSKPNITLPNNWYLKAESAYPQVNGQHDPQGAGQLEYEAQDTEAFVVVNYESALGKSYSNSSLADEATAILQTHQNAESISDVFGIADVPAGCALCAQGNFYYWEFVFVKDNVYFDVYIGYAKSSEHEIEALSLVNSIQVETSEETNSPVELNIIGFVGEIAIAVVLLVLIAMTLWREFLIKKRKNK